MNIFGWGKSDKPKKYAVARLEEDMIAAGERSRPLISKKESYIKYIIKLKTAIVRENESETRFIGQYLYKNGLSIPKTLRECDLLIERIELW